MRLRVLMLFLGSLLMVSCDTIGDDDADYEALNRTPADFGFRAIYGLYDSDDFDRVLETAAALVYDSNDERKSSRDERVTIKINGVSLASDTFEFDYKTGGEYTIEVGYDSQIVNGTITAPTISKIDFVNLPDTLYSDQPITVKWQYPPGEVNDGALIFTASTYVSGLLDPGTTSHTVPANTIRSSSSQFQLNSVRYMLFPNLRNPIDPEVRVLEGLDERGSFFGIIVGIDRYVEVIRSDP